MSVSELEIQANRFDLLSRLAGDISHEIKNPLHAMVINLELVRRRIEKGEHGGAIERIGIVEDEIRKVNGLSVALLESLRPPRSRAGTSDFLRIVGETLPLFRARAHLARIGFEAEVDGPSVAVPLRSDLLRQVLLNVMDRALGGAAEGGAAEGVGVRVRAIGRSDGATLELGYAGEAPAAAELGWLNGDEQAGDPPGLGLRVLRALVRDAGGDITATAEPRADAVSGESGESGGSRAHHAGAGEAYECSLRVVLPTS